MSVIPVILLSIVAILICANAFVYWRRRPAKVQEPIYHFQCPGCRRKLRYRARQVGNQGMCPRCRQRWVFPPIPVQAVKR